MTTNINLVNNNIETSKSSMTRLLWVGPLAMAAATAANTALYLAAGVLAPEVTHWAGAGIGQIAGANIVYLLIGAVVLAIVNQFSSQPARHYLIVATVGLILSLWLPISAGLGYGPPGTAVASMVTVVTLSLMHMVSYIISVPMYIRLVLGR
jgi:hypothetical protein